MPTKTIKIRGKEYDIKDLRGLTREDLIRGRARYRHLAFMRYCWQRSSEPLDVGPHTALICQRIDKAMRDFKEGKSTFLLVLCPFRHGKSDIVSRYLPPHFIGEFPDKEVIVTSYSGGKADEFGEFGRNLIKSSEYQELYPKIQLSVDSKAKNQWGIHGKTGKAQYFGLLGGTAGKGGSLIVIDDYFSGRAEAESPTIRDKTWAAFTDDIMTRRAPVSIVIVLVTPWHTDDIQGKIQKKMKESKSFPQFDIMRFPAKSEPVKLKDPILGYNNKPLYTSMYDDGWLFSKRLTPEWYESQWDTLSDYGRASIMQCNPVMRSGNLLRTEKIHIVDGVDEFRLAADIGNTILKFGRAWDLASSSKQTIKEDPDWTIGVKGCVLRIKTNISSLFKYIIYIDDVIRCRLEAIKRNKRIIEAAESDGNIPMGIEAFGAYKDAYTTIKDVLRSVRNVRPLRLAGDKVAKADPLEAIFESGNVYVKKASWNDEFIDVLSEFPSGSHDDDVDALACLFHMMKGGSMVRGDVTLDFVH